MTESEREFVITQLLEGRDTLLRAVAGLSEPQLRFKATPDGWSISDCIEHVAITEDTMFGLIAKGAPNTAGVALDPDKDARLVSAIVNRERKFLAPEAVRPASRFPCADDARAHFLASRELAITFARGCATNLRSLFTMHPLLGEIDCYRCLLLLALHPARHAAQIEEIKQQPQFPA